jgi:hypothetical protein
LTAIKQGAVALMQAISVTEIAQASLRTFSAWDVQRAELVSTYLLNRPVKKIPKIRAVCKRIHGPSTAILYLLGVVHNQKG